MTARNYISEDFHLYGSYISKDGYTCSNNKDNMRIDLDLNIDNINSEDHFHMEEFLGYLFGLKINKLQKEEDEVIHPTE
jgi:hypothetical protein